MKLHAILFLFFLSISTSLFSQNTADIDSDMYHIDHSRNFILINQDIDEVNNQGSSSDFSALSLDADYLLDEPIDEFEYGESYIAKNEQEGVDYTVYFTPLPIISINTSGPITNTERVFSEFTLIEPDQTITTAGLGVEYRGGYTQSLAKKPLRLEFWEDMNGNITKNMQLLDMRNDDDWNLTPHYNEPLRNHEIVGFELWSEINTLHYANLEPDAKNGIDLRYVEFFLNNEYQGLYTLGERIDRKQLKLKKFNNTKRGELYKGVDWSDEVTFVGASSFDNNSVESNGWRYKYPKPEDNLSWLNFQDFIGFIVNSSDLVFKNYIEDRFDIDNAIDYYLFINFLHAADNRGKNAYVARYDADEPYFYVAWDLDGIFGNWWDGTNYPAIHELLSNGLFDRMLEDCSTGGFVDRIKQRWNYLREDIFTHEHVMELFTDSHDFLEDIGVYERETLRWPYYNYPEDQLDYIDSWVEGRIGFLDEYFDDLCPYLGVNDESLAQLVIFPNPASSQLNVRTQSPTGYTISDMTGASTHLEGSLNPGENQLDVSTLTSGVYFIKTSSGEHIKFIKN